MGLAGGEREKGRSGARHDRWEGKRGGLNRENGKGKVAVWEWIDEEGWWKSKINNEGKKEKVT